MYLVFKVLTESAAPRVIRISAVRGVVDNSVYGVSLKETRVLARNKVRHSVRKILCNLVPVVRVKRNLTLTVYLGIGRLAHNYSVVVASESLLGVAHTALSAERNRKLKYTVGKINQGRLQRRVKLNRQEVAIRHFNLEAVALLVLTVKMLVNLLAVGLEFNVTVFSYKL